MKPRMMKKSAVRRSMRLGMMLACVLAGSDLHAEMRQWTLVDGTTATAEFIIVMGDKVVLRDTNKKQHKIPRTRFSEEDLRYIELRQVPKFKIDFVKSSDQHWWPQERDALGVDSLPGAFDWVFGARLKQMSAGDYNHELHVEFFAIGEEIDGDNYILFDRQESSFIPSKQKDLTYEFKGRTVRTYDYHFYDDGRRGQHYGGFLVVVTDSRGEIIAHKSPYNWIFKNLDALRELPLKSHFNKEGKRVFPPRPKSGFQNLS